MEGVSYSPDHASEETSQAVSRGGPIGVAYLVKENWLACRVSCGASSQLYRIQVSIHPYYRSLVRVKPIHVHTTGFNPTVLWVTIILPIHFVGSMSGSSKGKSLLRTSIHRHLQQAQQAEVVMQTSCSHRCKHRGNSTSVSSFTLHTHCCKAAIENSLGWPPKWF